MPFLNDDKKKTYSQHFAISIFQFLSTVGYRNKCIHEYR